MQEHRLLDVERDLLLEIQTIAPELPIHFLLNKMDTIYSEQVAMAMEDETWDKVNAYFPNANVFTFSKNYEISASNWTSLNHVFDNPLSSNGLEGKTCRKGTCLYSSYVNVFIRKTNID